MTNKHGNIKCEGCGSYNITMHVGYDGADYLSEAGDGSGFKWEVKLVCEDCGRIYPVCRVKNFNAVSGIIPIHQYSEEKRKERK